MALIRGNGGSRYYILCSRPRKGTSLGGTACFGVICVKIRPRPLAVASCKNPKKTNTFLVRKVTHAQKRNAWADRDELLHRCRGPRRNHLCRLVLRSLTGFWRGEGSNFGFFSIDLLCRPYNTLALLVCDMNFISPQRAPKQSNTVKYTKYTFAYCRPLIADMLLMGGAIRQHCTSCHVTAISYVYSTRKSKMSSFFHMSYCLNTLHFGNNQNAVDVYIVNCHYWHLLKKCLTRLGNRV